MERQEENVTNEEFSAALREPIAAMESSTPPAEVAEWHAGSLALLRAMEGTGGWAARRRDHQPVSAPLGAASGGSDAAGRELDAPNHLDWWGPRSPAFPMPQTIDEDEDAPRSTPTIIASCLPVP